MRLRDAAILGLVTLVVLSFFGWFVVMWCSWPTHGLGDVVMLLLVALFMLGFLAAFAVTWWEDHDLKRRSRK